MEVNTQAELTDKSLMPFGKYKGVAMANVPDEYLNWLYYSGLKKGDVKTYIEDNAITLEIKILTDDFGYPKTK